MPPRRRGHSKRDRSPATSSGVPSPVDETPEGSFPEPFTASLADGQPATIPTEARQVNAEVDAIPPCRVLGHVTGPSSASSSACPSAVARGLVASLLTRKDQTEAAMPLLAAAHATEIRCCEAIQATLGEHLQRVAVQRDEAILAALKASTNRVKNIGRVAMADESQTVSQGASFLSVTTECGVLGQQLAVIADSSVNLLVHGLEQHAQANTAMASAAFLEVANAHRLAAAHAVKSVEASSQLRRQLSLVQGERDSLRQQLRSADVAATSHRDEVLKLLQLVHALTSVNEDDNEGDVPLQSEEASAEAPASSEDTWTAVLRRHELSTVTRLRKLIRRMESYLSPEQLRAATRAERDVGSIHDEELDAESEPLCDLRRLVAEWEKELAASGAHVHDQRTNTFRSRHPPSSRSDSLADPSSHQNLSSAHPRHMRDVNRVDSLEQVMPVAVREALPLLHALSRKERAGLPIAEVLQDWNVLTECVSRCAVEHKLLCQERDALKQERQLLGLEVQLERQRRVSAESSLADVRRRRGGDAALRADNGDLQAQLGATRDDIAAMSLLLDRTRTEAGQADARAQSLASDLRRLEQTTRRDKVGETVARLRLHYERVTNEVMSQLLTAQRDRDHGERLVKAKDAAMGQLKALTDESTKRLRDANRRNEALSTNLASVTAKLEEERKRRVQLDVGLAATTASITQTLAQRVMMKVAESENPANQARRREQETALAKVTQLLATLQGLTQSIAEASSRCCAISTATLDPTGHTHDVAGSSSSSSTMASRPHARLLSMETFTDIANCAAQCLENSEALRCSFAEVALTDARQLRELRAECSAVCQERDELQRKVADLNRFMEQHATALAEDVAERPLLVENTAEMVSDLEERLSAAETQAASATAALSALQLELQLAADKCREQEAALSANRVAREAEHSARVHAEQALTVEQGAVAALERRVAALEEGNTALLVELSAVRDFGRHAAMASSTSSDGGEERNPSVDEYDAAVAIMNELKLRLHEAFAEAGSSHRRPDGVDGAVVVAGDELSHEGAAVEDAYGLEHDTTPMAPTASVSPLVASVRELRSSVEALLRQPTTAELAVRVLQTGRVSCKTDMDAQTDAIVAPAPEIVYVRTAPPPAPPPLPPLDPNPVLLEKIDELQAELLKRQHTIGQIERLSKLYQQKCTLLEEQAKQASASTATSVAPAAATA